jgi:hypothetical protein
MDPVMVRQFFWGADGFLTMEILRLAPMKGLQGLIHQLI